MATKAEREPAVPEESRKPAPQLLSAEQRGQMISVLRNPTAPLDSLSFDPSRLVELSLAECIGAPGTAARIAADAPFLSSMSSLTALDLSCSLREAHEANGHDGAFEAGLLASLLKILEAMPSALSALTLPESIGDFCLTGYGEGLGATLGRMKGTITSLTIRSAIQGSSDATPGFVQMLNHAWLPQLPHLNRLALVGCALHAAEPGVVLSEGGRGALGDQLYVGRILPTGLRGPTTLGPQISCQLAELAAATPRLTHVDLRGNLLWRQTRDTLTGMIGAWPELQALRLGQGEVDEKDPTAAAWTADTIEAIRAHLPEGCGFERESDFFLDV